MADNERLNTLIDERLTPAEPSEGTPPAAPGPNAALDARIDQYFETRELNERFELSNSLMMAAARSPDKEARLGAIAIDFGVPIDVIRRDPERWEQYANARIVTAQTLADPILREQLRNPEFAAYSFDDVDQLGLIGRSWRSVRRGYQKGDIQDELGGLLWAEMQGTATPDQIARAQGLSEELQTLNRGPVTGTGFLEHGAYGITQMGEQLTDLDVLGRTAEGAVIAAGTVAVAGQLGPQVATPEEIITVPVAAGVGGRIGWAFGLLEYNFKQEAAFAWDELRQMEDLDGVPLDPDLSKNMALGVGGVNALLETGADLVLAKAIPGLDRLLDDFGAQGARTLIQRLLATEAGRTTLTGIGRKWAGVATVEGFTEAVQETVNILGREAAQEISGQEFLPDDPAADWARVKEAATIGAMAGAGVATPGVLLNTAKVVRTRRTLQRRVEHATEDAEQIAAAMQAAATSKLRDRAPETFETYVETVSQSGAVQEVFVDAQTLNQSGLAEKVRAAFPSVAEHIDAATAQGGLLRIPVSELLTRGAGQDFADPLIGMLKTSPAAFSRDEAEQVLANPDAALERDVQLAAQNAELASTREARVQSVESQMRQSIVQTGRLTQEEASTSSRVIARMYESLGARLGITAEDALAKYPLEFVAPRPPAGTDATVQAAQDAAAPSPAPSPQTRPQAAAAPAGPQEGRGGTRARPQDTGTAKDVKTYQQDDTGRAPRGQIELTRDAQGRLSASVALFENADVSTILHEGAHFFLEVQITQAASLSQIPGLSEAELGFVEETDKILRWAGVEGGVTAWADLSQDAKTQAHETFARGFEAYLMEGKAPSFALRKTFARLRAWLVNIYRDATALNVTLTDEARQFFDRMLATESQISDMEQARALAGALEAPEQMIEAGIDPSPLLEDDLNASLQAERDLEQRSLRDMQWLEGARSRAIKALQAKHKALRRTVRDEVAGELNAQPVYQAMRFMRRGEVVRQDGSVFIEDGPHKMSIVEIEAAYEGTPALGMIKSALGYGKYGMLAAERAVHPQQIADRFGFSSVDHMVRTILAAPPFKEALQAETDARMLARHGDVSTPESLNRAADEAVHNDLRQKTLINVYNALAKAVGKPRLLERAARLMAEQTIARSKHKDVKPAQYTAAGSRAGRAAAAAMRKGDVATAAEATRQQVLQAQLAKAALEARVEVAKAIKYLKTFDKASVRKNLDRDFLDQIDALLVRTGVKPKTLSELQDRKPMRDWLDDLEQEGLTPFVAPKLQNEGVSQSWEAMSVEDLRALRDTLKSLEHVARLKHRLLSQQQTSDLMAATDEIAAGIMASAPHKGPRPQGASRTPLEAAGQWLDGYMAIHRRFASVIRQMDSGKDAGPFWTVLVRPMNERVVQEGNALEAANEQMIGILKPLMAMKGGLSGPKSRLYIPSIGMSLDRGSRMTVALYWGTQASRQRVMAGYGWSDSQVMDILSTLTKAELDAVNALHAFSDQWWPQVAAQEKKLTGVVPQKVEPAPWTITSKDGERVDMPGGYARIYYNARESDRAQHLSDAEAAKDTLRGAFVAATTRRGHTKERAQKVQGMRPNLALTNVMRAANEVIHDLTWREWLIDANRVLRNGKITAAIRDHYGPDVLKMMQNHQQAVAAGNLAPLSQIETLVMMLRSNSSLTTMGLSITTGFLQPFGITNGMQRVGSKWMLQGMAKWMGDAARLENTVKAIKAKSAFMAARTENMNREIAEITRHVAGRGRISTYRAIAADAAMILIKKFQLIADVPTWMGGYEKALAEGHDEATAVQLADQSVRDSQGSGEYTDLAEITNVKQHPMMSLFTMFYSYFSATLNLVSEANAQRVRDGNWKNPAAVAGWIADMALLVIIPALGPDLLKAALRGDDEPFEDPAKFAEFLARSQASYLLGFFVGARELSGLVQGYDYTGSPALRIFPDLGKVATQIGQGELDEAFVAAVARLIGDATGLPTTQPLRSWRGWQSWQEGDAPPSSILFGSPQK